MSDVVSVSVVVPCYRCKGTIARAVASVAAQITRPAQLVLVDDASDDGTLDVLHALQRQHGDWVDVVVLERNGGAATARNAGWDRATQAYVAFLDADDAWHPRKIELQYSYMQAHPETALSGHGHRELAAGGHLTPDWPLRQGVIAKTVTWGMLLLRHQFVTPSVMLKRELPLRFDQDLRYMEDFRLWLDVASAPYAMVKLELELTAIYKAAYGASGLSANMLKMESAELAVYRHFRDIHRLSLPAWLFLSAYSLIKYVRRRMIVRLRGGR